MVQATLVAAIAAAVQFGSPAILSAEESGRPALMIEIDGAIGPATARYVKEALTTAGERRGGAVFPRLDTPGGPANHQRPEHARPLRGPLSRPWLLAPFRRPSPHARALNF